jgi:hypothetical protein
MFFEYLTKNAAAEITKTRSDLRFLMIPTTILMIPTFRLQDPYFF